MVVLVKFISNPYVVLAEGLVGAGDWIKAHRLPRINKAFIFQRFPLGMMGAGRRSPQLPFAEELAGVGVHDLNGLLDLIFTGVNFRILRSFSFMMSAPYSLVNILWASDILPNTSWASGISSNRARVASEESANMLGTRSMSGDADVV
jgi:hypothetical protein